MLWRILLVHPDASQMQDGCFFCLNISIWIRPHGPPFVPCDFNVARIVCSPLVDIETLSDAVCLGHRCVLDVILQCLWHEHVRNCQFLLFSSFGDVLWTFVSLLVTFPSCLPAGDVVEVLSCCCVPVEHKSAARCGLVTFSTISLLWLSTTKKSHNCGFH